MKNIRNLCLVIFSLFLVSPIHSKVVLPDILSDHLVLQQQTLVKVWGHAIPNALVTVTPSWNNVSYTTTANAHGFWLLTVNTIQASYTPYEISFSDGQGETTILHDVLLGEVWFASGQSNMEITLNGYHNCPIKNSNKLIAESGKYPGIRMAQIKQTGSIKPLEEVSGKWLTSVPSHAANFSAVAYTYAMMMNTVLDVPIGVIVSAWGGSYVEGWLPREIVETYPDIDLQKRTVRNPAGWWNWQSVTVMYNGMLHPLHNYTIKGFLWYQGESNVGTEQTYESRFATMIHLWREEWGQGNLPFYSAELAPWNYGKNRDAAIFREMQHRVAKQIDHADIICTNDLVYSYEKNQIHPSNKQAVGNRFAYMALVQTYGVKGIVTTYPEYSSMSIEKDKISLHFTAWDCLSPFEDIKGFEIAGEDRHFYPAHVENPQDSGTLIVSSSKVDKPVAVRYCYKNWQIGNVVSQRGLPLVPFRTDHWSN